MILYIFIFICNFIDLDLIKRINLILNLEIQMIINKINIIRIKIIKNIDVNLIIIILILNLIKIKNFKY